MKRSIVWGLCIGALTWPLAAPAQDEDFAPGPWHYRDIPCVDTTVRDVFARLGGTSAADFKESGVVVQFNTKLGLRTSFAEVVHYQETPGNGIMQRERPGDRVQVCYLGPPAPTTSCNPDTDGRGRKYRVWDYRQHAQYDGINSEHDCGGA
jgi:hypothetical protein